MKPYKISNEDNARFFVRDDDVGELTDELWVFVETFLSRRIPVSYQIIPSKLTSECAAYMRHLWTTHPNLIEFGQHGLRHEMMVAGKRVWREFGPERSRNDQQEDIEQGRAILVDKLGGDVPLKVFTPPQHKYNQATVCAVARAGYTVFSSSSYPSYSHQAAYWLGRALRMSSVRHHGISYHGRGRPEAPITEISIAVAVDDGGSLRCPAAALLTAIRKAEKTTDLVGLMFHHAVYGKVSTSQQLSDIADALAQIGSGKFHRLSSLAD